ncbi:MAG TPA: fibronectin type III domain-containing protein [Nocardioides sp.]|uniref:fibronectin type III domain-containing protein n=1 Tax=Nocardioides sp. TaxID=35761 RepID=UPI002E3197D1|nr:fibronectin type III domain-containing protein [Nocardioides sp.]HEX5088860.1 fibronectin type III domain-containing protein [Nocardioides sp.]
MRLSPLLALAGLAATSLALVAQAPADARSPRLPRPAHGAQALTLLGDDVAAAAELNGVGPGELRRILRQDPTAWLDRDARMYYVEPTDEGPRRLAPDAPPFPLDQTFLLHSRPTSTHVIYLDFDGTTVSGTAWNAGGLPNGFYSGYSLDPDLTTFNDTEKEQIQAIWQRVSEDYAAFDVDVTTEDPGDAAIDRSSSGDQNFGTRALISDNTTASAAVCPSGCGGVAYVGVFDDFGSGTSAHAYHQPAWVFGHSLANNDTKDIAEAVSHEVGHNFGLNHDGTTATTSGCTSLAYYCGHAMWAPIMGVGYQKPVVQWSKGQYTNANNSQDDLAIIAAGGAPVIADEAGGTVATAAPGLPLQAVITSASDTDTFALGTCSGAVTVAATGAPPSPDLDIRLELLDSGGAVVASDDPVSAFVNRDSASGLAASVATTVPAGTYFARVDGVGNGTGATGYTDYASIGAYTMTVSGCATAGTPSAPTSLVVTPAANGTSATLTWSPPVSDGGNAVTGYQVSRSGAAPVDLGLVGSHTWTGLTPGTTYLFTVAARNSVGVGLAASSTASTPAAPGAPTGLSATSGPDGTSLTVAWSPPGTNGGSPLTGYTVSMSGGPAVDVGEVGSHTFSGLTRGTAYQLTVRARNAVGPGPSAATSVTTFDVPGAPAAPKAKKGRKGGKKTASVTWVAPADGGLPITTYAVNVYKARSGRLVRTFIVAADRPLRYKAKLKAGKYRFAVVATNAVGSGATSPMSRVVVAR